MLYSRVPLVIILYIVVNICQSQSPNSFSQVALVVKNMPACPTRAAGDSRFNPWVEKILWGRKQQPTPVFLPGKSHGQRSLEGYSPWGRKESDTTEYTHTKSNYNSCADHLILPGNSAPAALSRENSRRGTTWSKEQSGPGKTEQKQQSVRRGHRSRSEA